MAKFEKGSSGNPGGRPKTPPELIQTLRDMTPEVIEGLKKLIKDRSPRIRLAAMKLVFERAWGAPVQASTTDLVLHDGDAPSFRDKLSNFDRMKMLHNFIRQTSEKEASGINENTATASEQPVFGHPDALQKHGVSPIPPTSHYQ